MIINRELSSYRIGDSPQSESSITAELLNAIVEDQVNIETEKDGMAKEVTLASSDFRVKHILNRMKEVDTVAGHLLMKTWQEVLSIQADRSKDGPSWN